MPDLTVPAIERAVAAIALPVLGADLASLGARVEATADGGAVSVRLRLDLPVDSLREALARAIGEAVHALDAGARVSASVETAIIAHRPQGNLPSMQKVRNVIAVASGKGGVGKSTVTVNLALALAAEGARVGILDADVYGPSQPRMLGLLGQKPESRDGKTFEPLVAHGLEVISIGFLVDQASPVIWRGPMVTQAITQLGFQTNWHDLDYLLVDLPPGTGDTQLTLSQKVPLAGVLIVTTPQQLATEVAQRGLKMFEKVGVPVLGVIENMSSFICPKCGHEESLFGEGGGEQLAASCGVPLLGRVPLNSAIRAQTDAGRPPLVAEPDGPVARRYREIALRAAAALAGRPQGQAHRFPPIVEERR
ncbi:MAG: iron-sulfur cluster carrier protein ApbC [Gammaproteobacteria bacterium]|nr:iron-sulfur cluster carrier protein ApbC [Gammaproteobacteria bacterium]